MINNILLAAAVTLPVTPLCAPLLAEEVTSPKQVPTVMSGLVSGLNTSENTVPSMTLSERAVANNIACRNAARSKFFEIGARDMSSSDSNSQWGTVGNMQAVVWCRENRAVISVAGYSYNSVVEVREALEKAF